MYRGPIGRRAPTYWHQTFSDRRPVFAHKVAAGMRPIEQDSFRSDRKNQKRFFDALISTKQKPCLAYAFNRHLRRMYE